MYAALSFRRGPKLNGLDVSNAAFSSCMYFVCSNSDSVVQRAGAWLIFLVWLVQ